MKSINVLRFVLLAACLTAMCTVSDAQGRKSTKRTTKAKTKAKIKATEATADTTAAVVEAPKPAQDTVVPLTDTLPLRVIKKSLRPDEAIDVSNALNERTPLEYENLRSDDALYRHKIIREIDCREKMNAPFMYSADENNGNQRFISILMKSIQDSLVTAFEDERFTTPMTKGQVAKAIAGEPIEFDVRDSLGNVIGRERKMNEVPLDSFYLFRIKEEVIFDKESSRLFWRILGIAPLKKIKPQNVSSDVELDLGYGECFWVYYPDMRPILSKYEVYNGKNLAGRISWEELFENRMFSSRIIKTTMNNPKDMYIKNYPGIKDNTLLQLFEGENVKDQIFNYEQDLWSY